MIDDHKSDIEVCREKLRLDPHNQRLLLELGRACFVAGDCFAAVEALGKAVALDAADDQSRFLLANAHARLGHYEFATREFLALRKLGSRICDTDKELVRICGERYERVPDVCGGEGQLQTTIDRYEARLQSRPGDETAIAHLVQLHNFRGDYGRTRELARQALQRLPVEDVFLRNKVLNELELAEGKVVLASKPRSLHVTLSRRCNLRCLMCHLPPTEPWEIPEKTIGEITALFPYLEKILWQGGEVFVLDYFEGLLSEACKFPNLRQAIVTNAQLVTEEIAEKLVKSNVELTVSVDGTTKDTYEHIRKGASFETLTRNLSLLAALKHKYRHDMILNLNVVVMRSNYRQLDSFLDFAKQYSFDLVCFMPMEIPVRKSSNAPEDIFVYDQDAEALRFITQAGPGLAEKARRYNIRLENRLPRLAEEGGRAESDAGRTAPVHETTGAAKKMLCHIPWQQLLIDYDGVVLPDCQCSGEKTAGAVLGKAGSVLGSGSIAEIWNNEVMQGYRRAMVTHNHRNLCSRLCREGKISEVHLKIPTN